MRLRRRIPPLALAGWIVLAGLLHAQQPAADSKEFDLAGDQSWLDTGLDVSAGDSLKISATGTIQFPASNAIGPDGAARGWKDLIRSLPINDAGRGALVVRVGDRDTSRIFLVGASKEI